MKYYSFILFAKQCCQNGWQKSTRMFLFFMLVASVSGLYCSITHFTCLLMSTSITYEYTTVISLSPCIPYPGVDHLIKIRPYKYGAASWIRSTNLSEIVYLNLTHTNDISHHGWISTHMFAKRVPK